jgi:hypothetical protein
VNDEPKDTTYYFDLETDGFDDESKKYLEFKQEQINELYALAHYMKTHSDVRHKWGASIEMDSVSRPWVAPPEPDTSRGAKLRNRPSLDD